MSHLKPGTRLRVEKDPTWSGPWPGEPLGMIDPDADAPIRVVDLAAMPEANVEHGDRRPMPEYLVRFDEPQLDGDGDGDGPIYAAVIWEKFPRRVE